MANTVRKTSSLWAGVVALCQGVKLVGVVRESGNKAVWLLDDSEGKATAALAEWYEGNPLIGARDMLAARSILLDASLNTDNDKE